MKPYLIEDGFLDPDLIKDYFRLKVDNAYPIYTLHFQDHFDILLNHFSSYKDLFFLGRCGQFRYGDVDVCMRNGFELADRIIKTREGT